MTAAAVAAERVFGPNVAKAARYAELLATVGIERGLIGPREADRIWSRHLFNSVVMAPLIPQAVRVVDLGSGAGLPGIPVALARPDLELVLLEPMARRVQFLEECVTELELSNVTVARGRAQDGAGKLTNVVVARAVAPLSTLAELALALCRPGGVLLALKGLKAADEAAELNATERFAAIVHPLVDATGVTATVVEVRRTTKQGRKTP